MRLIRLLYINFILVIFLDSIDNPKSSSIVLPLILFLLELIGIEITNSILLLSKIKLIYIIFTFLPFSTPFLSLIYINNC